MRTRRLRTGLQITELGLGTSQLGNLSRETSDEDAAGAIEAAWTGGIRYFDTAPHYGLGLSERRVGALLRDHPRDDYVLSTKVGRLLVPAPDATGMDDEGFAVPATTRREWSLTRDGIRRSIDDSLARLGLDRIDIAYLHDPDEFLDQAVAVALPALIELRDEGVLNAVGAGMNSASPLARFVRETDIDVVMVASRLTLLDRSAVTELLPLAADRGVAIVAAAPYNSGILANPRPRELSSFDYAPADATLIGRANRLANLAEAEGVDLPTAALQFALGWGEVVSVVAGGRDAGQVQQSVKRYETTLPSALREQLESVEG